MEEMNMKEMEYILKNSGKYQEKVQFLSENKDAIIDNFNYVSYPLFKILVSDKSLSEIDIYNEVVKYLDERKQLNTEFKYEVRNEKYIIHSLIGLIDRVATNMKEKESARKSLNIYNYFIKDEKSKIKVRSAI